MNYRCGLVSDSGSGLTGSARPERLVFGPTGFVGGFSFESFLQFGS